MRRSIVKQITAPLDTIELGEALARKHTGGNFSALVRMLIEARAERDGVVRVVGVEYEGTYDPAAAEPAQ